MSLDTLNNGDTGLQARTKINAAIAAVNGLGTMATQAANAVAITGGTASGLTGLAIRSTGAVYDLTLATSEVLTTGRTLSFNVGDASRTLTLSGSPTLSGVTITGAGTIATGGFTLTVPATGAAALLGTANAFTAANTTTVTGVNTTVTPAHTLVNGTASTSGQTQLSPSLKWTGSIYTTGGGALPMNAHAYVHPAEYTGTLPIPGGNPNLGYLQFMLDVNGSQNNIRSGYAGFNDLKLDAHGTLWINAYTGRQLALGGTPEGGSSNMSLDTASGIFLSQSHRLGWVSGFNTLTNSGDIELARDAAGTLAQRAGSTAQTFRIYNTFTSTTNNEHLETGWTSSVAHIWTVKGSGGGTARSLALGFDSTALITLSSALVTISSGTVLKLGNAAQTDAALVSTHSLTVQDSTGTTYRIPVLV